VTKTKLYYKRRLIGSYIRSWERPGDLPRVIEILCLFASGAQRNVRKDTNNISDKSSNLISVESYLVYYNKSVSQKSILCDVYFIAFNDIDRIIYAN
jgi:hypothetical protein